MRNKWIKRLFPLIVLLLLVPWSVTYVYAYSDNIASQDTAQIEVTEDSTASDTAAEEILPSHVYVLNSREVVTEETWTEMNSSQGAVTKSTPYSETASPTVTITASVTVMPSRQIVVNENDTLVEIWSNTTGTERNFYSLRVKEQSLQGPEHPLTQEILAQYNRLLGEVDWTETGQVY